MNEEALKQLYSIAQKEGYGKSIEDFTTLLSTNEDAVNNMYEASKKEGYTKPIDDFKTLVGYGGQLKKKDQPNATESPSASVQGQSSLGSKPVPVDNSFLTKEFTPQDFGINTEAVSDQTSFEVQKPIDEKSAALAVRDNVFESVGKLTQLDNTYADELIQSEPFKVKDQLTKKAQQLKAEIEEYPKKIESQEALNEVNSKVREYNNTLSEIVNQQVELDKIISEQDASRSPIIRDMASKMSMIYPDEEFITEEDGVVKPTNQLMKRIGEQSKAALESNEYKTSEITGYSIIDAPLSSFNKMFYNTVKIPFAVGSTMEGEPNEVYNFLNDQAKVNQKINTDVKGKQLTQGEIEDGIIQNTLKGNYKAAATNLGVDVLNTIPQVLVAAYSPSVYLNNTGRMAVGQAAKTAFAPSGLAYNGVSTGVIAMSAEKSEESYNQAIEDGLNPVQATALSTFKGLTTVLAESFFTKDLQAIKGTNAGADLAKEIIKNKGKAVRDIIKQYPKQFADAGGEEMFEEMSENTLDAIADYLSTGKPINPYEIADASLVGLVSGGGSASIGNTKSLLSVIRTDANILKAQKNIGDIDRYIENNELTTQQIEALELEKERIAGDLNKYTNDANALINSMSDEEKGAYIEASQELAQKLDVIQSLPEGEVKDNMKEDASNLLDLRTQLLDKYKEVDSEQEVVQEEIKTEGDAEGLKTLGKINKAFHGSPIKGLKKLLLSKTPSSSKGLQDEGLAIWLTSTKEDAIEYTIQRDINNQYAVKEGADTNGEVYEVEVDSDNFLVVYDEGMTFSPGDRKEFIEQAKQEGKDGVEFRYGDSETESYTDVEYGVFDESKVKITEVPSESETQPVQEVEGEVQSEQEGTQTTQEVTPKPEQKPTEKEGGKSTVSNSNPNNSLKQVANNFKDGESFAKQVREALKEFKGKFKENQVKSIAIKAQKVKDQAQLDDFLEYANKVFENANYQSDLRNAKKMAKSARSKFRKANKAVGNQSFKYAISISPDELSNKELERYREFLKNVNSPFFNESEFTDEIEYFADKYEITEAKSVEAGEKALENKTKAQDDLMESIKNAKADPQSKVIRATDEVLDTILNLSKSDIESLSKKDAYILISAMQHSLDETAHTNEMYVVVRRFKSKSIEESLKDILGSIRTKKLFRDIFRTGSKETIKNYIEKNPFKNIGLIAKGIEQTGLYKTLIQPIAIAYSSYLGRFRSYQDKVDKIYKKNKLKTIDDIKIHIVGLAKQKALNPKAKELSSIEDVMSAIEIEVGRNESFKKQGEEFIAAYQELLGGSKTFNWEDAYNNLSKGAKEAFDFIEMHHTDMQPLVAEAAARNGEGTIVYDYYSPINVLYTSASDLGDIGQEANKFMSGNGTVSKSVNLKNRKQNNSVILLGAKDSSLRSTNSILRNYYVREPLVTLNNALNKIIKDENVKGQTLDFAKAIDASIKQTVTRLFENTHYEGSAVEKVSENLAVKGALRDLVSVSRAAIELATNGIFAAFYSPSNSLKGLEILSLGSYNGQKIQNIDLMDMAVKVATTQFSRIFQGDSGSPRQERENLLMKTGGKLEQIGNTVLSKADNLIAKPMWVGNFIGEFEAITGEKLNIKELNSSTEYYAKHKDAINQARDIADDRLAQGFSSMNPFESVAYAQVSRNRKVLDVFDKYFIRFRIGEFASVAKAINNLVYGGEMSPREASALIVATFARMSLYNFAILKSTAVAGSFIAGLIGIDSDDEEKDKESLERQIGNSLLSSALTLLLFRRLGNLGSAALTLGVEYMNMEKGFDLGLRDKEEYNNFSDSYLYHPTISSLRLGQDYKGGEMMGINIAASMAGPYNKYIKNLGEVAININNGGLTIPNPMGEDIELIEPSYKDKSSIKRANDKAAKSGTDLLMTSLGIPFSRDIANIWGYLNYEKYKDKKKKGGSNRPARPNLPKPVRPSRPSN